MSRCVLLVLTLFAVFSCRPALAQDEYGDDKKTEAQSERATSVKSDEKPKSADETKSDDQNSEERAEGSGEIAEEDKGSPLAGHSYHGEVFNEGPRQAAYLMGNVGNVTFPITTKNETVQKFFNQGVAQLHGFWYLEAERTFRQVAAIEPDCAMAYWGMAMANTSNKDRAKDFIKEAVDRKDKITEREKMYIDALNAWYKADEKKSTERAEKYTDALEKILYKYPEDLEAKAFLGLQMWMNRRYKLKIQSHLAVDALLQQVLSKNPLHPCHHYVIHLWDHERAENALTAARLCGKSAPGIAHMWHMPGHIYSDLQRYEDAVWQQEASARVDHAHMMRDQVLPDQISNFAHNNEWLIRNLIKLGRVGDAMSLARNMTELPRHPKYNHFDKRGSAKYGRDRLFDVLNTFEMWDEMIELAETPYLEPTEKDSEQIKRLRNVGRAWFRKGEVEKGREYLAMLEGELKKKEAEQTEAGDKAAQKVIDEYIKKQLEKQKEKKEEGKESASDSDDKIADAAKPEPGAKTAPAAEEAAESTEQKEDCEKDDAAGDKSEVTPKPDKKTEKAAEKARKSAEKKFIGKLSAIKNAISEMKGHVAVSEKDYDEALKLFKKAKSIPAEFKTQVQLAAGKKNDAIVTAKKNVKDKKNEVVPLACLVETLWECGKKDEAKKAFEDLRKLSGSIDSELAVFEQVDAIAKELGHNDWHVPYVIPEDFGWRPELEALGPFRWQAPKAKNWVLPDTEALPRSLKDYEGKPVVVIFYLGFGCLHCAEQLSAFAPKTEEFEKAGFELIAISTDAQEKLTESRKNYNEEGKFPFPLVADPSLTVFKNYRAYDDFEKQPLHGTFIIDGKGRIRWHDISYEPFMDPDFVLKEGLRLLNQTTEEPTTAQR